MKLTILETSDTHGFLMPTDYISKNDLSGKFGLSRIKNYFDQVVQKNGRDHVLLIDNGDFMQGSALASYVNKFPSDENLTTFASGYNQLDYEFGTLGNHDFNYGESQLRKNIDLAKRKFLTANVIDKKTGAPIGGQAYQIIEKSGLKIGIIGVTTEYVPHWENPINIENISFLPVIETLKKYVPVVRPQVDLLIVGYHGGFERDLETNEPTERFTGENVGAKILAEFSEIDILLTGHQHRKLFETKGTTSLVQPGYQGELVGKVEVEYQLLKDKVKIEKITPSLVAMADFYPDEKYLNSFDDFNLRVENWLDQPLGELDDDYSFENASIARINGSPSINLIHQIQLENSGADISAASIVKENVHGFGEKITTRDLMLNYPYTSELVTVEITGEQLREILEYSATFLEKDPNGGKIKFAKKFLEPKYQLYHFDMFYPIKYEFDLSKPEQHRLTKLTLNGQEIKADQKLELVVNKYRVQGGGKYPVYDQLGIKQEFAKDLVEMVIDYLQNHPNAKVDLTKNYLFK